MAERDARPDHPVVFLASRNPRKIAEMQRILAEHVPGIEVLGLDEVTAYDEPVETEPTFEGNALIKARAGVAATGLPAIADDSGLCVDALNGMPGVLSARWAGTAKDDDANNRLLLEQLADVPDERRARALHVRGRVPAVRSATGSTSTSCTARCTAGSSGSSGGAAASATTCCSSPTTPWPPARSTPRPS